MERIDTVDATTLEEGDVVYAFSDDKEMPYLAEIVSVEQVKDGVRVVFEDNEEHVYSLWDEVDIFGYRY